jgi:hypothetical protein
VPGRERFGKFGAEEIVRNLAHGFLTGKAVHILRSAIPIQDAIPCNTDKNRIASQIEQACLFDQTLFGPLPIADVACDLRSTDNLSFEVLDRRNR